MRREATPAERRLWPYINAGKLGFRFNRQMPVGEYVCDLLCRSLRIAIELDGDGHTGTVAYDHRRETFIASHGIRTIRFSNADVMGNVEGVVAEIARVIAELPTPDPSRQREGR